LVCIKDRIVELFSAQAFADHLHQISHIVCHHDLHGFWEDWPGDDQIGFQFVFFHAAQLSIVRQ